jgi:hypothetical protein
VVSIVLLGWGNSSLNFRCSNAAEYYYFVADFVDFVLDLLSLFCCVFEVVLAH